MTPLTFELLSNSRKLHQPTRVRAEPNSQRGKRPQQVARASYPPRMMQPQQIGKTRFLVQNCRGLIEADRPIATKTAPSARRRDLHPIGAIPFRLGIHACWWQDRPTRFLNSHANGESESGDGTFNAVGSPRRRSTKPGQLHCLTAPVGYRRCDHYATDSMGEAVVKFHLPRVIDRELFAGGITHRCYRASE